MPSRCCSITSTKTVFQSLFVWYPQSLMYFCNALPKGMFFIGRCRVEYLVIRPFFYTVQRVFLVVLRPFSILIRLANSKPRRWSTVGGTVDVKGLEVLFVLSAGRYLFGLSQKF